MASLLDKLKKSNVIIDRYCMILSIRFSVINTSVANNAQLHQSIWNLKDQLIGIITAINEDNMEVILFKDNRFVRAGEKLLVKNHLSIRLSNKQSFFAINPLGEILLGSNEDLQSSDYIEIPVFSNKTHYIEKNDITDPLLSGINIIDFALPIGKGQRFLILGDRKTGKTTSALTILKNNIDDENIIKIYVGIGQRSASFTRLFYELYKQTKQNGFIFVYSSCADPIGLQYIAPFVGTSIAEYFAKKLGKDVILVYDDLTKHARICKEISLLNNRFPGRDSFPGDIFYIHSNLLERATSFQNGGSITSIPIIETLDGELSDYIPTNIISITDGQIFLDRKMFNMGYKPSIDIKLSVSRVGSQAQSLLIKSAAKNIKSLVSQSLYLEGIISFVNNEQNSLLIRRGRIWRSIFLQDTLENYSYLFQVVILILVSSDYFTNQISLESSRNINKLSSQIKNFVYSKIIPNIDLRYIDYSNFESTKKYILDISNNGEDFLYTR